MDAASWSNCMVRCGGFNYHNVYVCGVGFKDFQDVLYICIHVLKSSTVLLEDYFKTNVSVRFLHLLSWVRVNDLI